MPSHTRESVYRELEDEDIEFQMKIYRPDSENLDTNSNHKIKPWLDTFDGIKSTGTPRNTSKNFGTNEATLEDYMCDQQHDTSSALLINKEWIP